MLDWITERNGDQDEFDFYPVNVNENANLLAEYVAQIWLETEILMVSSQVYQQYLLRGRASPYPMDYVIDGDGIVQYAQHEYEPELMLETIDRLLDIGGDGVDDEVEPELLQEFQLVGAYPNPFNSSTTIRYQLPHQADVSLEIFDVSGRCVATLVKRVQSAGDYQVVWDGSGAVTGLYICRAEAGGVVRSGKVVLVR
jgi:hypothetical protein